MPCRTINDAIGSPYPQLVNVSIFPAVYVPHGFHRPNLSRPSHSCSLTCLIMAQKPIMLYTSPTPNGHAITIFLEELKAVYPGFDYEYILRQKLIR